jgi:glycosyltransferase involved in cell wall biosynthesis
VKDYETLVKAIEILAKENLKIRVSIIGGAGKKNQEEYLERLKKMVKEKGLLEIINFLGPIPNKDIVNYLQFSDLFANMSYTGSLDKAILEAMACGLPVLTCNEALLEVLGEYREMLMYSKGDFSDLAGKIKLFHDMEPGQKEKISRDLREIVIKGHSLERFIKIIIQLFQKL